MTCSITIDSISAADPLVSPPTELLVQGIAIQCGHVSVSVSCGDSTTTADATVFAAGNYVAVLENPGCLCGSLVNVHAECVTDPTCTADVVLQLLCGCPVITDVTGTSAENCNNDGTRTVTFSATVTDTSGSVTVVNWEYEPAVNDVGFAVTGTAPQTIVSSHDYPPGTYTATLHTITPPDCPDIQVEITVDECPPSCPELGDVTVTAGECDSDGKRLVTLSFAAPLTGDVDFGNGNEDSVISALGVTNAYTPPGPYTATISVDGCPPLQIQVGPLEDCPTDCPGPEDATVTVAADCNADGTRNVTFTFSTPVTGDFDFGDSSAPTSVTGSSLTHAYPPVGPYTAVLTVAGCPPLEIPVGPLDECPGSESIGACCLAGGGCVEVTEAHCNAFGGVYQGDGIRCVDVDCGTTTPGGGNGGDTNGDTTPPSSSPLCGVLGPVIAALLASAIVFALATATLTCMGVAVPPLVWGIIIGMLVAAAMILALWYLLCFFGLCPCPTICDLLAILWSSSLAGLIAGAYLFSCCPPVGGVTVVVFIAITLLFFYLWALNCFDRCQMLYYLLVVLVTVAGWMFLVLPTLFPCGLAFVPLIVAALGGLVVLLIAPCLTTSSGSSSSSSSSPVTLKGGGKGRTSSQRSGLHFGGRPHASLARTPPSSLRGLGDAVSRVMSGVGIKPCTPCKARAERLNRAVPFK